MIVVANFTILGQPCSKANSRKVVDIPDGKGGKRRMFAKSSAALAYERDALKQIPPLARVRFEGPVCVTLLLFYASERPDLDESIVLDVLQDRWKLHLVQRASHGTNGFERTLIQSGVYRNDRQVREKHVYHGIDKRNPRSEIKIEAMQVQSGLELVRVIDEDAFGPITA